MMNPLSIETNEATSQWKNMNVMPISSSSEEENSFLPKLATNFSWAANWFLLGAKVTFILIAI
jgi:hypothetical protein